MINIDTNNSIPIILDCRNDMFLDNGSNTLTKAELSSMLFEQVGLNKREAKEIVDEFFEVIGSVLERGEEVKLSGFGSFQLREKKQRPGRNPKTGETIPISARRVVVFHASQKLKDQVNISVSTSDLSSDQELNEFS